MFVYFRYKSKIAELNVLQISLHSAQGQKIRFICIHLLQFMVREKYRTENVDPNEIFIFLMFQFPIPWDQFDKTVEV
jgi:hypothetical protein